MTASQEEKQRRLVQQTVCETLSGLGFNVDEPGKLQADMHYLRKMRNGSEDMMRVVRRSAITMLCTTSLFLIWEALKGMLHK
ncbi:MAG: hypothetical protein ACPG80_00145 [Rickettsiales bacterium]